MGLTYSSPQNSYDWKPELPDFRDNIFKYPKHNPKLPNSVDLRNKFKEYTQNFGSSAATSIASILDFYELQYTYNGSVETSIRNCIKNFKIIDNDKVEHEVKEEIENEIDKKNLKYSKLCNFKNQLKQCLVEGCPIIFGFTIYESFESDEVKNKGIISNPHKDEKILGGLCAVIVGYNEDNWIVKHSLGKEFGDNGYIYIPYEILAKNNNLTSDFWRIKYNV